MRNTPIRGEVVQGKTALGLCAFADFFAGIHPATPVRKLIFQPSTQTSSLSRLNRAVPLTAKTLKITRQLKLCTTPFEGFPRTGNLRDSRHSIRQSLSRSRNACSRPLRASPNTFQEPAARHSRPDFHRNPRKLPKGTKSGTSYPPTFSSSCDSCQLIHAYSWHNHSKSGSSVAVPRATSRTCLGNSKLRSLHRDPKPRRTNQRSIEE